VDIDSRGNLHAVDPRTRNLEKFTLDGSVEMVVSNSPVNVSSYHLATPATWRLYPRESGFDWGQTDRWRWLRQGLGFWSSPAIHPNGDLYLVCNERGLFKVYCPR